MVTPIVYESNGLDTTRIDFISISLSHLPYFFENYQPNS